MDGQKTIAKENLSLPDPRIQYFIKSSEAWVERCQLAAFPPEVPANVVNLLEVARGAIIYGWFFYPLMTLGVEQCYRCLETAARARARQLGIPTERSHKKYGVVQRSFADLVKALHQKRAIHSEDLVRWDSARDLRNIVSHPEDQMIAMPAQVVGLLDLTIGLVCRLFPQGRTS